MDPPEGGHVVARRLEGKDHVVQGFLQLVLPVILAADAHLEEGEDGFWEIQEFGVKAFAGNGQRACRREPGGGTRAEGGAASAGDRFLTARLRHVKEQRKLQALNIRSSSSRTWKRK